MFDVVFVVEVETGLSLVVVCVLDAFCADEMEGEKMRSVIPNDEVGCIKVCVVGNAEISPRWGDARVGVGGTHWIW